MTTPSPSRSWPVRGAALWVGALATGLLGLGACSPYPTFKQLPVDCTVEGAYELSPLLDDSETIGVASGWWSSADGLGTTSYDVEAIEGGGRCGSSGALVLRSQHCNDWGALFGFSGFAGSTGRDASAWEGLSFWARAPGETGKAFTILLDDPNTASNGAVAYCQTYNNDADGGTGQQTGGTIVDPMGNVISGVTGAQPLPDQCGNGYLAVQEVTADWRFYVIPFTSFTQTASPNRVPNGKLTQTGTVPGTGIITSDLVNMILRMPKEATMDLWIDNLGFFRHQGASPATPVADKQDAGAEPPHE